MEKTITQKKIGNECREVRKMFNITLRELSERSGVPIKTLSTFENGRSSNINIFLIYLRLLDKEQMVRFARKIKRG